MKARSSASSTTNQTNGRKTASVSAVVDPEGNLLTAAPPEAASSASRDSPIVNRDSQEAAAQGDLFGLPPDAPAGAQPISQSAKAPISASAPQALALYDLLRNADVQVHNVPLDQIQVNRDIKQFKAEADPRTGVVQGEALQGEFQAVPAKPILLLEKLDGSLEVVTGRHRLDLARRNNLPAIPANPPRNHAPKHLIDDLPPAARHHTEPGHFQMDTVHSPNGRNGLLTLVDPYHATPTEPRRFYLYFLPTLTQDAVTDALRRFRRDLRANGHELKTILTDNGPEFLHEDTLEALLRVPIYYCHPYCAWEKGSVERHNRLLRTYHPKPTDFSKLSPHALRQTHRLIVHYPRSPRKAP